MLNSKKYKRVVHYVLIALMLFPLILAFASTIYSQTWDMQAIVNQISSYCISPWMRDNLINSLGDIMNFSGAYWQAAATTLTNAVCVQMIYVVYCVLAFIPHMCIKLLRIGVRKDDE